MLENTLIFHLYIYVYEGSGRQLTSPAAVSETGSSPFQGARVEDGARPGAAPPCPGPARRGRGASAGACEAALSHPLEGPRFLALRSKAAFLAEASPSQSVVNSLLWLAGLGFFQCLL